MSYWGGAWQDGAGDNPMRTPAACSAERGSRR
jgi:hypothetical protein